MFVEFVKKIVANIKKFISSIINIILLGVNWLKNFFHNKLKHYKKHKVAFVDVAPVVSESFEEKIKNASTMTEEEFIAECNGETFMSVVMDTETDEIIEYEVFRPENIDDDVRRVLKKHDNILVVQA